MGAVAGGIFEIGFGGGGGEGVGVVDEEVAEIEGVGDGFIDGYGAVGGWVLEGEECSGGVEVGGIDIQGFWFGCGV